jgi:hypothetical protein
MRPPHLLLALALAASPAAAAAPDPLPEPSAAALELARHLAGSRPAAAMLPLLGATGDSMVATMLEAQLLSTGILYGKVNCVAEEPRCREAARQAAAEYAPAVAAHGRRRAELTYAYFLADSMSEAQIAEALTFFRSPAGGRLLDAMREAATPNALSTKLDPIARAVRERLPDPTIAMTRRFLDRTKDLPRREFRLNPPEQRR